METEKRTCLSCEAESEGNFCNACGERLIPKRIAFGTLLADLFSNMITLELPFPRTMAALVTRPGKFIRQYIEGRRKNYYRPIQFFLLSLTLYYLSLFYFSDPMAALEDPLTGIGAGELDNEKIAQIKEINDLAKEYSRSLVVMQIPIQALFFWLFFRRTKFNYWEFFTLTLYGRGTALYLNTLLVLLQTVVPLAVSSIVGGFAGIGIFVYQIWVIRQFSQDGSAGTIFKAIGALILTTTVFTIFVVALLFWMSSMGMVSPVM